MDSMRSLLLIIALIALLCGCTEDRPVGPKGAQHFSLETDPQLSPDGDHIYYASHDSFLTSNSGIYRASVSMPIRIKLVTGVGLSSPTVSPDDHTLAYLDSGKIKWIDLLSLSTGTFPSLSEWDAIVFVDSTKLIAGRDDVMELIDLVAPYAGVVGVGYDPDDYGDSTYIFSRDPEAGLRVVLSENYWYGARDTLLRAQSSSWLGPLRSPSKNRNNNHLVFSVHNGTNFDIYSARGDTLTLLGTSNRPGVEIISDGLVLFTGQTGLLYNTTVYGGTPQPWLHIEDSD